MLRPLTLHRSFVPFLFAPSAWSRELPTCDNPQRSANPPRKANGPGLDRSANFRFRQSPQPRRHAQKRAVRWPVRGKCWPTPLYRLHGPRPPLPPSSSRSLPSDLSHCGCQESDCRVLEWVPTWTPALHQVLVPGRPSRSAFSAFFRLLRVPATGHPNVRRWNVRHLNLCRVRFRRLGVRRLVPDRSILDHRNRRCCQKVCRLILDRSILDLRNRLRRPPGTSVPLSSGERELCVAQANFHTPSQARQAR